MRRTAAALCVLMSGTIVRAAPHPATDHDDAARHLATGRKLYEQGDLVGAERELLLGQQLDPMPVFNYTLGQIERQLGRCNRAIDYYRAYQKGADANQRASTQVQINRCKEALAEKGLAYKPGAEGDAADATEPAVEAPPPAPIVVTPPPITAPVVVAAAPRGKRWYRDALGLSLVGGGAALVVAGAALTAVGNPGDARSTYANLEDARDRRWMSPTGIAFLCVGGAAIVGGAVRLALVARSHR